MKIYIDGKFYDKEKAQISVFDHGLLYGDGIFEGIRIYNGKIFKLREHIHRLFQSARAILLEIPCTEEKLEALVINTVNINNKHEGYIRILVTRGAGDLGIDPFLCKKATIIIIVGDIKLYPQKYYTEGIEIITASSRRIAVANFDPRIKSLNYLNNVLAKIEARQAGCLEAVMLNSQGYVTECTGDNIFIIKERKLLTPAAFHGILNGITRKTVIELASTINLPCQETTLTTYDLYNAAECFLTGSGAELIPVVKIDNRIIGNGLPGKITESLTRAYKKLVNS